MDETLRAAVDALTQFVYDPPIKNPPGAPSTHDLLIAEATMQIGQALVESQDRISNLEKRLKRLESICGG